GAGSVERLTRPSQGEAHVPESWSPDGKHLTFAAVKGTFSLWLLSVEDKIAKPFGGVQSSEPIGSAFAPDGHWIAYGAPPFRGGRGSANRGVFIQPFPATGSVYQVPKQRLDFHPVWGPKATELIYVPSAALLQYAAVSVTTQPGVTFGTPVTLPARVTANRLSNEPRAFDVLSDGRFVGLVPASEPDATTEAAAQQLRVVVNWFEEFKARVPVGVR